MSFGVSASGDGVHALRAWGAVSAVASAFTAACPLVAPPAPQNLTAGTATETSIPLSWDALAGATKYRVEYRVADSGDAWTEDDAAITGPSHTVDDLSCGMAYEFQVSAYGDGTTYTMAWGAGSAMQTASTSYCRIWTATLAVGTKAGNAGYSLWSGMGALSPTEMSLGGMANVVQFLVIYDGEVNLGLDELFTTGFVLSIGGDGGAEFRSADATLGQSLASHQFIWANPGLGWSDGDEVTVMMMLAAPAPQNLVAGTVTDGSVPLSWNAVAGATTYRVEYREGRPGRVDAGGRDHHGHEPHGGRP